MKLAHRTCSIGRQFIEQPELIENPLPVRLKNFATQSLRRARCLLQHDCFDPFLREREGQHGPASPGSDHRNVGLSTRHP
jgi:hypothetical protein